MAPKKDEKVTKLSPQEGHKAIIAYLREKNRPFSVTDISGNIGEKKLPKALATKLLKEMHERNEIAGQASGKQLVYHTLQDEIEEDHTEQLQAMQDETKRLKDDTLALALEEKELRAALRETHVQMPLPELKAKVDSLEAEKADLEARLVLLRAGNLKPVDAGEKEKINKAHKKMEKTLAARKRIRLEVWKTIEGQLEKEEIEDTKECLELTI